MTRGIPAGMTFEKALALGYTGRIECKPYLAWLRAMPCDTCGAPPPSEASHLDNENKGHGTKCPDLWAIPECRKCHTLYERLVHVRTSGSTAGARSKIRAENERRKARAALYLLQAFVEGRLSWCAK